MARRADPNPFEEDDVNPFSEPAVRAQIPGKPRYSAGPFYTTDLKKWERDLQAWEEELKRKEQEIRRREEALASTGFVVEKKNWPPFFPIMNHNIAGEIPLPSQKLMYIAFASWLGMVLCLVWNLIAVSVALTTWGVAAVTNWLLAVIYALAGCPGSYALWYKPLYRCMRKDSALRFGWFFLSYMFHIGFCIFAVVAPQILGNLYSLTGVLSTIQVLITNRTFVSILYIVGCALFCLETLLSIWVLQKVYAYFRSSG